MAEKKQENKYKNKKKKSKAAETQKSEKTPSGWNTTDEDEIRRRCLRAEAEPMKVVNLNPVIPYFSDFTVESNTSQIYRVEIRSLGERLNSCSCPDYDSNGLSTCKHVEKVLLTLKKRGKRKFKIASQAGSLRVEIYVDPADSHTKIMWPQGEIPELNFLKDFFSASGNLLSEGKTALPVVLRLLHNQPETVREKVRLSTRLQIVLAESLDFTQKIETRAFFLTDVADGKYSLEVAKVPLYDYQKQGILHLAFLERAILADEMGLGKTAQAIGAAELLRKLRGIRKVLVISPTSLKAEWEEQIAKFVDLPSLIIEGKRGERLRQYQQESFFYLTNYEQIVRDREDIQRLIRPDLVILDEAQRIKNWRTKTAMRLKQLESPYAFVLTGTPLENRIDDIYSIVQFLYPKLFGPLFRFNREFYELDEHGKPIGYKNLHLLHQRLKPILLRRLKKDIEDQLPDKTVTNYFVQMSKEQSIRYKEYNDAVASIVSRAKKRPLLEEEFKKLQMSLSAMRMLCDTPYILDENCRVCPKLQELESIFDEIPEDGDTKVIIFSEWERMLFLVRDLLEKMNIEYAWHTGSVHQRKRREEIDRFKEKKECGVFLSTDCGAVGLNLQVANVVINLDLPWNPAKLEQRIARAWRKHQTKKVQVINLISEGTIEHRMLGVLDLKQKLSNNILDFGDVEAMEMPSGRKVFMDQLNKIMGTATSYATKTEEKTPPTQGEPLDLFQQEVLARFKPRLHQLTLFPDGEGNQTLFAVIEGDLTHPREQMQQMMKEIEPNGTFRLEVMDRISFEAIQRLCKAGVLSFNQEKARSLYHSPKPNPSHGAEQQKRLKLAQQYQESIDRKERMASLLIEGEFYEEALAPLQEVFELSLKAFAALMDSSLNLKEEISLVFIEQELVAKKGFSPDVIAIANQLRQGVKPIDKNQVVELFKKIQSLTEFLESKMNKFNLEKAA